MYEFIDGFHKALHIESTLKFVLLAALIGALFFGAVAWIVDAAYKNSTEYIAAHRPVTPPPDDSKLSSPEMLLKMQQSVAAKESKKGNGSSAPCDTGIRIEGVTNGHIFNNDLTNSPCTDQIAVTRSKDIEVNNNVLKRTNPPK